MKKLTLLLLGFIPFLTFGQYFEIGAFGGTSYYQGDLSPGGIVLSEAYPAFGIFARYNAHEYVSFKFNVYHGNVSGDDANSLKATTNNRNLSFRSPITEFGINGEINILGYQPYGLQKVISPYVFIGVSVFNYNPKTLHEGEWVRLQPLGTEGQGMANRPQKYNLLSVAIPFGLGAKYAINDRWNVGLELGFRSTFTDYIDDVSTVYIESNELAAANGDLAATLSNRTGVYGEYIDYATGVDRGNPDNKDWFFFGGITFSFNFLDNGLVGNRNRNSKRSGCKVRF